MKNLVFYKYAPNHIDKLEFDDFHLDSIHQPEREFFKARKDYFYSFLEKDYNIISNENDIAELSNFTLIVGFDDSFRQLFSLIEREDFNKFINYHLKKISKVIFWEMDTDWTNYTLFEYNKNKKNFVSYFEKLKLPYKIFSTVLKFKYDDSVGYFAAQNAMTIEKLDGELLKNDYFEANYSNPKSKYFYSAANSINTDRLHYYKFIDDNKLWDKNNLSFFSTHINNELGQGFNYSTIVYDYNRGKGGLIEIDDNFIFKPKPFEDEQFKTMEYSLLTNLNRYSDSLFEMVFETMYEACENKIIQTSEKTLKPFIQKKPFLTFSYINILSELKNLGFKTFDFIFSEGYDSIEDHTARLFYILDEYKTICERDINELHDIVKENYDVMEHNYKNIKRLLLKFKSDFIKEIENE